jgi:hypothetical protein
MKIDLNRKPEAILRELNNRDFDFALAAVKRLVNQGIDQDVLVKEFWRVSAVHYMCSRWQYEGEGLGPTYGEEPYVVRSLPRQLRKLSRKTDAIGMAPMMQGAFSASAANRDEAALPRRIGRKMRQYAALLEKAYQWQALGATYDAHRPPSPAPSERELIDRLFLSRGKRVRIPFDDISAILSAMVELIMPPHDWKGYEATLEPENIRKRYQRERKKRP